MATANPPDCLEALRELVHDPLFENLPHDKSIPIVLVPGFSGWGAPLLGSLNYWGGIKDIPKLLLSRGYTVIVSSIAPLSSNWERACELYQELMSEKFIAYNTSDMDVQNYYDLEIDYGNYFDTVSTKPEDQGPEETKTINRKRAILFTNDLAKYAKWKWSLKNKVHFICHSQGGTTVRLLIDLMTHGSLEHPKYFEKKGRDAWTISMTTLGTPHKGTTICDVIENLFPKHDDRVSDKAIALLGRLFATLAFEPPALQAYNLQLDHWGIGRQGTESFQAMRKRFEGRNSPVRRWALSRHNAFYDNSIKGVSELPATTKIPSPHIHYFTLSFHATVPFSKEYPAWGSEAAETFPASMRDFAQAILKHIPVVGRPTDWLLSHTIFQPVPFIGDPTAWILSKLAGTAGWVIFKASVPLLNLVIWGTTEVAQRLIRGFGYDLILPSPGKYLPRKDVIPLMLPTVYAMGGRDLSKKEQKLLGDKRGDWYLNDGVVNTASMDGPVGTAVSPISGFLEKTVDERRGCYWHFGVNDKMDHADEIGVWIEETTADAMVQMYKDLAEFVSRLIPERYLSLEAPGTAPSHRKVEPPKPHVPAVEQEIHTEAQIQKLVAEQDSDALMRLLARKDSTLTGMYPWTLVLLEMKRSPKELATLLLRSENLEWLQLSPDHRNKHRLREIWETSNRPPSHQASCAHEMCAHALRLAKSLPGDGWNTVASDLIGLKDTTEWTKSPESTDSNTISGKSDKLTALEILNDLEFDVMSICGVAGVFNPLRIAGVNPGYADLQGGIAKIHYDADLSTVVLDFQRVAEAMRLLSQKGPFCDRFSIFVDMADEGDVLRTVTITYADVTRILSFLRDLPGISGTEILTALISRLGWSSLASKNDLSIADDTNILHLSSLLAQVLSLGLVTYTRGHSREFNSIELSRSVDEFHLCGTDAAEPLVRAHRVRLRCLGAMLRRPVWMFSLLGSSGKLKDEAQYEIWSSIEDLCDLWGGVLVFKDATKPTALPARVHLYIGEGILCEASSAQSADSKVSGYTVSSSALLHYQANNETEGISVDLLEPSCRVRVGAPLTESCNFCHLKCQADSPCKLCPEECQKRISEGGKLKPMNTRLPSYRDSGISTNISASYHGFGVSRNWTRTRDNGASKKSTVMQEKSLTVLNSPLGLELSLCTGLARRVPVRKLLTNRVVKYLAIQLGGRDTIELLQQVFECEHHEFNALLMDLDSEPRATLHKATELLLLAMEYTGTQDNDELVLWWPEPGISPRGIRINKKWFSSRNPWLPVLKDSETCAVFGMLTTECLQHGELTCTNTEDVAFRLPRDMILQTSVLKVTEETTPIPMPFRFGQFLLWSKEENSTRAVLHVTQTSTSTDAACRLRYSGKYPKVVCMAFEDAQDILEQQELGDVAQDVLILPELP